MAVSVAAVIADKNVQWGAFMSAGDAKGLAGLYAQDCKVMPPGYQTVNGRDAFEKVVEALIASGCTGAKLTTDEIDPKAETAPEGTIFWERGHYIFYKEGVRLWKRGSSLSCGESYYRKEN
ncbi:uncharacterized protein [Amphiura filiformis]|uniref:uncharacterized protein n=1 Tax=Amphiura filiformis TaxID=82378 RepID=UPI003B225EB8